MGIPRLRHPRVTQVSVVPGSTFVADKEQMVQAFVLYMGE